MGFFGLDTRNVDQSQNYIDERAAATEGSLIGYGAQATTVGGSLVKGEAGSQVSYTPTEIYNDPTLAVTAIRQQRKLTNDFLNAFRARDDLFKTLLEGNTALAEQTASGGEIGRNRTMLYVTLAVLALVGWIFWKG